MKISSQYIDQVTTQSYQKKPTIEGVELVTDNYYHDDGGNFAEIYRVSQGKIEGFSRPVELKQISMSVMVPGVVKAYHLHYKQDDVWFVSPYERLLVNLHDLREDSPTFNQHQRLVIGAGKNTKLLIPKGIAHGAGNPYEKRMTLFYATSEQFDPKDPDEHRLPWDIFGQEVWEIEKG